MKFQKALISQTSLREILDCSRSGLYKIIKKNPDFPKPLKTGPSRQASVFYVKEEVEQWIESRINARNKRPSATDKNAIPSAPHGKAAIRSRKKRVAAQ